MGVSILPDYGQQLGEALAKLGAAGADIINPRHEFQAAFRRAAAADHSIIQRLSDLTLTSGYLPSMYMKLLPRDVLDSIFATEPSPAAYKQRAAARAAGELTPEQNRTVGQGELLGMSPVAAASELQVAPRVPEVANMNPADIPTTAAAQGAARAVSGLTGPQLQAGGLQGELIRDAGTFLSRLTPKEREAIGADASVEGLMNNRHFMESLALQRELHRASRAREADNIAERYRYLSANDLRDETGVGNVEDWRTYLYDARARQHAMDAAAGKVDANDTDVRLLEIDRAHKLIGPTKRRLMLNRTSQAMKDLEDHINGRGTYKGGAAGDDVRPRYIQELNALLQERQIYGGPPVRAIYDKPANVFTHMEQQGGTIGAAGAVGNWLTTSPRLMYVTGTGKNLQEVPPDVVLGPVAEQEASSNTQTQRPQTRQQLWDQLRRQNPSLPDSVITNMVLGQTSGGNR